MVPLRTGTICRWGRGNMQYCQPLTFRLRQIKADESAWSHFFVERTLSGIGNDSLPGCIPAQTCCHITGKRTKPESSLTARSFLWTAAGVRWNFISGKRAHSGIHSWRDCGENSSDPESAKRMYTCISQTLSHTCTAVKCCHKWSTVVPWLLNFPKTHTTS